MVQSIHFSPHSESKNKSVIFIVNSLSYYFLPFRLTERQQTFGERVIASLQINNVQVEDGGSYVCQASNVYGRDQQLVQLYVQEPPNRPSDLRVVSVTSTTVNVQWDHNGDQTSKYIVQHKKSDGTRTVIII